MKKKQNTKNTKRCSSIVNKSVLNLNAFLVRDLRLTGVVNFSKSQLALNINKKIYKNINIKNVYQ